MTEQREAWEREPLADQFHASSLIAVLESGLSHGTVFPGTQTVSSWLEMLGDRRDQQKESVARARLDVNLRMFFSRKRVGWCEFSARLLSRVCCRCSTPGRISRLAAP
jgi:hypothetical protein